MSLIFRGNFETEMNDVWFTSEEPVRGVCIGTWICDQEGSIIGSIRSECEDPYAARIHDGRWSEQQVSQFKPADHGPSHDVPRSSADSLSEVHMIEKLNSLIQDAREAFHTVLSRNADLEREIDASRILPASPSQGFPTPRSEIGKSISIPANARIPVVPKLSLPTRHQRSFDISTPPTYKENVSLLHRPQSASNFLKGRRQSSDSGSIRRGITVFNS